MLDLMVLDELKRKKKIPRQWLLKDRKKKFVTNTPRKKERKCLKESPI